MPSRRKPDTRSIEPWKRWPRSADVRQWMLAILRLADYMDLPSELASTTMVVAVEDLARLGAQTEALDWCEHICERLPPTARHERSHILETAAEIAFDASDLPRMESYLRRIIDLQPLFTLKADAGCQARWVRRFRLSRGLLPPAEASDDEERRNTAYDWHRRLAQDAMRRNDAGAAVRHLREARSLIDATPNAVRRPTNELLAVAMWQAGDREGLESLLVADASADRWQRLSPKTLLSIHEHERAIARLEQEAAESLDELRTDTLNAHFPAMNLKDAICGMADAGEMNRARAMLRRVLQEGQSWLLCAPGEFISAVLRCIAEAVARVEGPEQALQLVHTAIQRAEDGSRSGWRSEAIRANAELLIDLSPAEEALKIAKSLRSRLAKRRVLAKIHAKRQDWDELHRVLNTCKKPLEAAELIWWTNFVWRPAR